VNAPQAISLRPPEENTALVHMIERVARDVSFPIDRLEKLMEMHERVSARNAESAWNEAMAAAQTEMRPVVRDSDNPQTRSKYASYAALDRAIRPTYTSHGFALSFNTAPDAPENHVRVICDVMNKGHSRRYSIDMPADGKGAKGGDVMTKTHATGAAVTYGMRYLLKMIFNIATGERDDDGNGAGGGGDTLSDKQIETIQRLIQESGCNIDIFLKLAKAPSVCDIQSTKFAEAVGWLERKKAAKRGAP